MESVTDFSLLYKKCKKNPDDNQQKASLPLASIKINTNYSQKYGFIFISIVLMWISALQGKFHLCIPFRGIVRPQSQFPHSCVCERFIYTQDQSTYIPAAEYSNLSWKYLNLSQIYECRNWETEHYYSVLETTVSFLGIQKWEPYIYIGFSPSLHLQCVCFEAIHLKQM